MTNKYPLLLLILILKCTAAAAQFAIIEDKDGFVNVRDSASINSKIIDKLNNGTPVYYFEKDGNWGSVDYKKEGKEVQGFAYKTKLRFLDAFFIIPIKTETTGKTVLQRDSLTITISTKKFNAKKAKLAYYKDNPGILQTINGKKIFGTDGEIPTDQYDAIEVQIGKRHVSIPQSALSDLFQPGVYKALVSYNAKTDVLYIQTSNSDGAGAYEILWVIEKGKYKMRCEAYGF